MVEKNKIFIVEDHQLFREGLKSMLSANQEFDVVGGTADGREALRMIQKTRPDLVLLDLTMPVFDGYSVLREIRRTFSSEIKVLVLSIHNTDQYIIDAFEEGANGYCVKDTSLEELRLAVRSVLDGKRYISPSIADKVLEGYMTHRRRLKSKSAWESITAREREVLKLVGEGYSNKEIAKLLHISTKTVEKHRSNLMAKLDLHNAASLAAYAAKQGLTVSKS